MYGSRVIERNKTNYEELSIDNPLTLTHAQFL